LDSPAILLVTPAHGKRKVLTMHTIQMKGGSGADITVGLTLNGAIKHSITTHVTALINGLLYPISTAAATVTEIISNSVILTIGTDNWWHEPPFVALSKGDETCFRNTIHKEVESFDHIDERGATAPT